MTKRVVLIFLTVLIGFSLFVVPVAAASLDGYSGWGTKVNMEYRYDNDYRCRALKSTNFSYIYILQGEQYDFSWIQNNVIVVWSTERLVIEGNNMVFDSPFYFMAGSYDYVKNFLFCEEFDGNAAGVIYQSESEFQFKNVSVIYSNKAYTINGKAHSSNWPTATFTSDALALQSFLSTTWQGLRDIRMNVFGTSVSAAAMLAGPFVILFSITLISKLFGFGQGLGGGGYVRESNNHSNKKNESEEEVHD